MKKCFSTLFFVFFLIASSFAQSFEGYLHPNQFIWMDLAVSKDNVASGTYFNKHQAGEIKFSGIKSGDTLMLTESGSNPSTFRLVTYKDSIVGTWKRAGTKSGMPLRLYATDAAFKYYSAIPKADALATLGGGTLAAEMATNFPKGAVINPFEITFAEKGLLGTKYTFSKKEGEHTIDMVRYHAFSLKNNKQIDLMQELEPSKVEVLVVMLNDRSKALLRDYISNSGLSEDEWIQELGGADKFKQAIANPNVTKAVLSTFRLEHDGIHLIKENHFGLSPELTALDLDMDILLPYSELKPLLKKDSVLSF
ncbi:MAG: hypothetical protein ACKOYC_09890 [Bacteroidota bacterium]